jgi:hypothetical protein
MQISDLLPRVLPDVPGCPSAVARDAILKAADQFFTDSAIWDEVQDPIEVVDGQADYDLEAPSGARCINVKTVYGNSGYELTGVDLMQLANAMPDWQTAAASTPRLYTRAFGFDFIRVFPLPTNPVAETLRVHGVYTVKDTSTTLPDEVMQRYADEIASGAKYRLMVQPRTTWQDLKLAQFHRDIFLSGIASARITAAHGKTTVAARVQPRRFGR